MYKFKKIVDVFRDIEALENHRILIDEIGGDFYEGDFGKKEHELRAYVDGLEKLRKMEQDMRANKYFEPLLTCEAMARVFMPTTTAFKRMTKEKNFQSPDKIVYFGFSPFFTLYGVYEFVRGVLKADGFNGEEFGECFWELVRVSRKDFMLCWELNNFVAFYSA